MCVCVCVCVLGGGGGAEAGLTSTKDMGVTCELILITNDTTLTGINIAKRIDMLQKQFRGLHRRLLSELNEQRVSVDDILAELTLLPIECCKEYENLIQQKLPALEESTRITTLFNRLNPLFTFIDYGLLQHLISNLGSTELKEDMTSYIDEVQEFMQETTVGDVIDHWPGDEEAHANYSKLRVKFKDDPKTYTLERLNNFRRKFCSRVRLSDFIFGLISLEPSESFFISWLLPTVVVPKLMKSVRQIEHSFYELQHILSITVDQEQLYPSASAITVSPLPQAAVVQSPKRKPLEVRQAGDLISPTLTPKSTVVKKDVQSKTSTCTDDTVNIIVIGWEGGSRFAKGIIGQNKDSRLKLWDCSDKRYSFWWSDDVNREKFVEGRKEQLRARISTCQTSSLVLYFNDPISLPCRYCISRIGSIPNSIRITVSFTVSDLTRSLGDSIWNNAIIVQPFQPECQFGHECDLFSYQSRLREDLKGKFAEYKWRDIHPEVISNIHTVPIMYHVYHKYPKLPDGSDWLSSLWDTCLQRMTESAQHTFLRANADRIKLASTSQKREDSDKPLYEQAIIYTPRPVSSKVPIHSAVSNLLGTEIAGPLGQQQDEGKTAWQETT